MMNKQITKKNNVEDMIGQIKMENYNQLKYVGVNQIDWYYRKQLTL